MQFIFVLSMDVSRLVIYGWLDFVWLGNFIEVKFFILKRVYPKNKCKIYILSNHFA